MSEAPEMVSLSANVPVALLERLRAVADAHDRSVSAEVRQAVRAHVEAEEVRAA